MRIAMFLCVAHSARKDGTLRSTVRCSSLWDDSRANGFDALFASGEDGADAYIMENSNWLVAAACSAGNSQNVFFDGQ